LLVRTHSTHHARHGLSAMHVLELALTQSTVTKYTTKMKAKFSYCDQIKFNEPLLKSGIPE